MIIVKSRYSGSSKSNIAYMNYISKREGVEYNTREDMPVSEAQENLLEQLLKDDAIILDSEEYKTYLENPNQKSASNLITQGLDNTLNIDSEIYANYIAERPNTVLNDNLDHGLFDKNGVADLDEVKISLKKNSGNVWKIIVSLPYSSTFTSKEEWERVINASSLSFPKAFGLENQEGLHWVGAVHQAKNPHAHIMVWSDKDNLKLSNKQFKEMNRIIKSSFTSKIYENEVKELAKEHSKYRETLKMSVQNEMYARSKYVDEPSTYFEKLKNITTYRYAYLDTPDKKLVNDVLKDMVENNPIVKKQFDNLIDLKTQQIKMYINKPDIIEKKIEEYKKSILNPENSKEGYKLQNAVLRHLKGLKLQDDFYKTKQREGSTKKLDIKHTFKNNVEYVTDKNVDEPSTNGEAPTFTMGVSKGILSLARSIPRDNQINRNAFIDRLKESMKAEEQKQSQKIGVSL